MTILYNRVLERWCYRQFNAVMPTDLFIDLFTCATAFQLVARQRSIRKNAPGFLFNSFIFLSFFRHFARLFGTIKKHKERHLIGELPWKHHSAKMGWSYLFCSNCSCSAWGASDGLSSILSTKQSGKIRKVIVRMKKGHTHLSGP